MLLPSAIIGGLENVGAGIYMLQSWFSPFVFIFFLFLATELDFGKDSINGINKRHFINILFGDYVCHTD